MNRTQELSAEAIKQLFTEARTNKAWLDRPVSESILHKLYDLVKMGPTSGNSCPARFVFVKSPEAKAKLIPCMDKGNVTHTESAPVTVIVAQDMMFYEKMDRLFPFYDFKSMFASNKAAAEQTAFRNSSLQGAYLILAARTLGLDAGPMSGFNNEALDKAFFSGTSWKSNFLCNLGYGDATKLHPRLPRLAFEEGAKIV